MLASEPEFAEQTKDVIEPVEVPGPKDVVVERQTDFTDAISEQTAFDESGTEKDSQRDLKEEASIQKDSGANQDEGATPEEDAKTGANVGKGGGDAPCILCLRALSSYFCF